MPRLAHDHRQTDIATRQGVADLVKFKGARIFFEERWGGDSTNNYVHTGWWHNQYWEN
jgi:hypothetical protein